MSVKRKAAVAIAVAAFGSLGSSTSAFGASYTLDGSPVDAATAQAAARDGGLCQATEPVDGVNRCFSSSQGLEQAFDAAVAHGATPPGYGAAPSPNVLRQRSAARTGSRTSSASPVPSAAAGCADSAYNHIFTGASKGGDYGYYGYNPSVQNFNAPFYKSITSFQHYFLGAGYYAGSNATVEGYPFPSGICDSVMNMASAHPEWNDRFASVITQQAA